MSIHHAVAKKAQKLGITLVAVEGGYSATVGNITNTAASATDALDLTVRAVKAEGKPAKQPKAKKAAAKKGKKRRAKKSNDEDEDGEGEEGTGESKSIVKKKYKKLYRPTKDTNGDDFAEALHAALFPDGEEFDIAAFNAACRANDIDPKRWAKLKNNGMRRMNLGNVLRGMIRREVKVTLGNKTFKGSLKSLPKVAAPKD